MIVNAKMKWKNVVKSRKLCVFTNDLMKETYDDKLYYIFLKLNSFKNDYIFFEQIFNVFQLYFQKSYSKFHSQIISHFSLNQKKSKNSFTSFFNANEPDYIFIKLNYYIFILFWKMSVIKIENDRLYLMWNWMNVFF